jgi:hypothetical protein
VFDVRYNPATHKATFTDLSFNLGDFPVTGIAENGTGDVFAATDFGVAALAAGSTSWVTAGTGLPTSAVYGLTLAPQGHVLYAATHGRGAWSMPVAAVPSGPHGNPTGAINGPSTLELGAKATYSATGATPNGGAVTFKWSLPGTPASATGSPVSFTPTKLGVAVVVLTISDSSGAKTTVTQAVTVKDTKKPKVSLKKIKTVKLGKSTTIKGSATDPSGIKSAKITFGDGTSKKVKLGSKGTFTVKHRYKKAKTYKVKLTATDKASPSHTASKTVKAKVRK